MNRVREKEIWECKTYRAKRRVVGMKQGVIYGYFGPNVLAFD